MRTFEYRGYSADGEARRGLVEAVNMKDARERLAARGILVDRLTPAGSRARYRGFGRRKMFSDEQRAATYRELAALIRAGLPLAQALQVLIDAPDRQIPHALLAGVRDRLREGATFGASLKEAGGGLPVFEEAAIAAGEHSGDLATSFERLADFLEAQLHVKERLQTAMIYPAIILTLTGVIAIFMLGVMIPRFASIFADAQFELPMVTRVVLAGGRVLGYLAVVVPLVLLVGAWFMVREWRRSADFRCKVDRFLFRIPLWGRGYESLSCLRFARTLAFLLDGGIALPEAVVMAGRATGSEWVESSAVREAESITHGSALAEAVQRIPPLANGLPGWIQAGEASGDVAGLLKHAADRFDQVWERLIARAVQVFEAVIILFVGLCVLMLALAILLPILSLNQTIM